MVRIGLLAAVVAGTLATPAFADYYIVHGPDRRCRVVESFEPGRERDLIRVGPLSIGSRQEAERQVRVICRDGYYREEREERR